VRFIRQRRLYSKINLNSFRLLYGYEIDSKLINKVGLIHRIEILTISLVKIASISALTVIVSIVVDISVFSIRLSLSIALSL
jgi:hypothetical protein